MQKQIERTVSGAYDDWQIGLTNDPSTRKAKLGNPLSWLQWQVDTESAARNIAAHFIGKGMQCAGACKGSANEFIYLLLVDSVKKKRSID